MKYIFFVLMIFSICSAKSQESGKKKGRTSSSDFTIVIRYLNDSLETIKSDIYEEKNTGRPFIYRNACDAIYPWQTKSIVLTNEDNEIYKGLSIDSTRYFLLNGNENLGAYNTYPGKENVRKLYFRSNGGKFEKYERTHLKKLISTSPSAMKKLRGHFFWRDSQIVLLAGGSVVAIGGFVVPLLFPAGAAIATSSLHSERIQRKRLTELIDVYNETAK